MDKAPRPASRDSGERGPRNDGRRRRQGYYEVALDKWRRVVETLVMVHGPAHRDVARALKTMGLLYADLQVSEGHIVRMRTRSCCASVYKLCPLLAHSRIHACFCARVRGDVLWNQRICVLVRVPQRGCWHGPPGLQRYDEALSSYGNALRALDATTTGPAAAAQAQRASILACIARCHQSLGQVRYVCGRRRLPPPAACARGVPRALRAVRGEVTRLSGIFWPEAGLGKAENRPIRFPEWNPTAMREEQYVAAADMIRGVGQWPL